MINRPVASSQIEFKINLVTRNRPIKPDSSLGKLNALILEFNESDDILVKYDLLVKLYFKANKARLKFSKKNNTKTDSRSSLETWLSENDLPKKLGFYLQYFISKKLENSSPRIKDKPEKELIRRLNIVKDGIHGLNIDDINAFESIFKFFEATIGNNNNHLILNNILNYTLDLMYKLLSASLKEYKELKKIKELYISCSNLLEMVITSINSVNEFAFTFKQSLNRKLEISEDTIRFFHQLSAASFSALISMNLDAFSSYPAMFKYLGGGSNLVYKLEIGSKEFIIKLYPLVELEEYHRSAWKLAEVRNKLGQLAEDILGRIYFEKECLGPSKSDGEIVINGRLEIAEYFPGGNLESKCKEAGKLHDLIKLQDILESAQADIINYGLNIITLISQLNQFNVIFPDIKPSNFMINENDKLRIPDYKTMFVYKDLEKVPAHLIAYTGTYLPPEIDLDKMNQNGYTCNALAMQQYAIGLTLYELATGDMDYKFEKVNRQPNFNYRIFKNNKGKALCQIIQSLMHSDPKLRLQVDEALRRLQEIDQNMSVEPVPPYVKSKSQFLQFKTPRPTRLQVSSSLQQANDILTENYDKTGGSTKGLY
ncbi:protein kinase domain-containing protein [Aquicella lusitana]|uniref:Protein kinase-like protein n=1 Tax=Aquicella lusitana TaxID=254246 RepID=A0A370G2N5_9COXI|nr:hypothetical protein [Aquicella lusitana]RDI37962.1 protein kinase-like protein [Aquicella lusitana]VVC74597.1 hypothetical protein AQULUS_23630 [Aquicella lusitana]